MAEYDFWAKAQEVMANRKPIKYIKDRLPPFPSIYAKHRNLSDFTIIHKGGHVEVFKNSKFMFSADNEQEARWILKNEDF